MRKRLVYTIIPTLIVNKVDPISMRRKYSLDEQLQPKLIVYSAIHVWANDFSLKYLKEWLCWTCCKKGLKKAIEKCKYLLTYLIVLLQSRA